MSLTRRVAYNTVVQVVGKVLTTLISLVLIAALTRYLGVSGYGSYTTIFAYIQFFAVLADFGFFWFFLREISKPEADIDKITGNVLTFRTLIAIGIFAVAFFVGLFIPQYHDIRYGIGIIAGASFWMALNGTYVGIFQSKLRMDKAALTDILGRLAILGIVFYQIKIGTNLTGILWAYFFGNFLNFTINAWLGRMYVKIRPGFDIGYWKHIFRECLPISIVSILSIIYFKIDTVILSLLKTPIDVGIYGPPYKVLEILILYPGIFMGNVFPIFVRYFYSKDERFKSAYQRSFDFLLISAVPIVIGVIFTANRIIEIIAGKEFVQAHTIPPVLGMPATSATVLQILIIAVGISFISHIFGYMVIAIGKQTKLIWPNAILVIFNVALNLVLIPKISYIGAAIVTVLTEILVVASYYFVMRRHVELKLSFNVLWKVALAGIILGLVLKYLSFLSLWYLIPIAVVVYLLSLWLVKGISKDMVLQLVKK